MVVAVRKLEFDEIPVASLLLAGAFAGDPFIGYFFADPRRRRLALPPFFRAVLYDLVASEGIFACTADGELAGVAAWMPPEPGEATTLSRLRASVASMKVRVLFPRAAQRVFAGFEGLGAHHPTFPHWYLAFIGIESSHQRRGLGARLLAPVLERADRAGISCYLETPFPDTRTFYRQLGFEEADELCPVAGAPHVWTMTRAPRGDADSLR